MGLFWFVPNSSSHVVVGLACLCGCDRCYSDSGPFFQLRVAIPVKYMGSGACSCWAHSALAISSTVSWDCRLVRSGSNSSSCPSAGMSPGHPKSNDIRYIYLQCKCLLGCETQGSWVWRSVSSGIRAGETQRSSNISDDLPLVEIWLRCVLGSVVDRELIAEGYQKFQ